MHTALRTIVQSDESIGRHVAVDRFPLDRSTIELLVRTDLTVEIAQVLGNDNLHGHFLGAGLQCGYRITSKRSSNTNGREGMLNSLPEFIYRGY